MSVVGVALDGDQLVLTQGRDFRWVFQNLDSQYKPKDFPAGDLFFELDTGGQHNALQQVSVIAATNGTYKLGLGGELSTSIDYYDNTNNPQGIEGDVRSALEGLSTIGPGNVVVYPADLFPVWVLHLNFNAGRNEIQEISVTGNPSFGSWRIGFGAASTTDLAFNITPEALQVKLEAVSGIGVGNVLVTQVEQWKYRVEFVGALAATSVQQLVPYAFGWGFSLGGGFFPSVSGNSVVKGSSKLTEPLVNVVNKTVNDFFDSFEAMLGVDVNFVVNDELNMTISVTGVNPFVESDLVTFGVDVTSQAIKGFFNSSSGLLGVLNTINIDFYWNHVYEVEFVGVLAETPVEKLSVDQSLLTGVDNGQRVVVEVLAPGRERFTLWHFDVEDDLASLKVESEEVDRIRSRTRWQLVFMPDGEPAGGDPVARGRVWVQR